MGKDVEDVKVRERARATNTFTLTQAVQAAVASHRDEFRKMLGSEPIVEVREKDFVIATYGGGKYQEIGKFSITELPGCCGVIVFYHASVAAEFSKRGIGKLFLEIRQLAAVLAGYSIAQATVIKTNKSEIALLEGAGFACRLDFKNKRTSNEVIVFFKKL